MLAFRARSLEALVMALTLASRALTVAPLAHCYSKRKGQRLGRAQRFRWRQLSRATVGSCVPSRSAGLVGCGPRGFMWKKLSARTGTCANVDCVLGLFGNDAGQRPRLQATMIGCRITTPSGAHRQAHAEQGQTRQRMLVCTLHISLDDSDWAQAQLRVSSPGGVAPEGRTTAYVAVAGSPLWKAEAARFARLATAQWQPKRLARRFSLFTFLAI